MEGGGGALEGASTFPTTPARPTKLPAKRKKAAVKKKLTPRRPTKWYVAWPDDFCWSACRHDLILALSTYVVCFMLAFSTMAFSTMCFILALRTYVFSFRTYVFSFRTYVFCYGTMNVGWKLKFQNVMSISDDYIVISVNLNCGYMLPNFPKNNTQ